MLAGKSSSNSFLSEIGCKFVREVLLSFVRLKAVDIPSYFLFDPAFDFLEMCKHFISLPHGEDLVVPREVIDKGDIVSTSSDVVL